MIFYSEVETQQDYQNEIFYDCNSDTSDISSLDFRSDFETNRYSFGNYHSITDSDSVSVSSSVSQLLHISWMLRDV